MEQTVDRKSTRNVELTVEDVSHVLGRALARSLVGIGKAAFLRRCLATLCVDAAQAEWNLRPSFRWKGKSWLIMMEWRK